MTHRPATPRCETRRAANQQSHTKGNTMAYKGQCFCGTVQVEATGEPVAMGYCHCSSCRSWSAAPVNAFTLWKPEAVKVTAGAGHPAPFQNTPLSRREYCAQSGGQRT